MIKSRAPSHALPTPCFFRHCCPLTWTSLLGEGSLYLLATLSSLPSSQGQILFTMHDAQSPVPACAAAQNANQEPPRWLAVLSAQMTLTLASVPGTASSPLFRKS